MSGSMVPCWPAGIVLHGEEVLAFDPSLAVEGKAAVGVKVLLLTRVLEGLHVAADGVVSCRPFGKAHEDPILPV